jgi:membrane protease YdiL (CAAX protease family)
MNSKFVFFLMPIAVLLCTRLGIEISVILLPMRYAWIPSFLVYYLCIIVCIVYVSKKYNITLGRGCYSLYPVPRARYMFWGVIIPALLPLVVFILNIRAVPVSFIFYILLFSCINPYFEETFWRGLLYHMPAGTRTKILYSSFLFSFSHYFLWGAYWLAEPKKWIAAVVAAFIMGILWMWFFDKQKNLLYPIISHFFVDVFNLSVALFFGLKLVTC